KPTAAGTTSPPPQPPDQQRCPTDQELQLPCLYTESRHAAFGEFDDVAAAFAFRITSADRA
ncbi:hypothetical protein, partial [Streptomyces sp. NPDC005181]|uniref:hypothetical protein n=1 Tax=Streptomyces sp. NPDC005181 TaxID=3156869 RepID=UPI0033B64B6A